MPHKDRKTRLEYHRKYNAEYYKAYYRKNIEKMTEKGRKYREDPENRTRAMQNLKKWKKENPEKVKMQGRRKRYRRRARLLGRGSHTVAEWEGVKESFNCCCAKCGRQEPFADLWYPWLTEDHIVSVAKGGSNYIENIQPLCQSCNSRKCNKAN